MEDKSSEAQEDGSKDTELAGQDRSGTYGRPHGHVPAVFTENGTNKPTV